MNSSRVAVAVYCMLTESLVNRSPPACCDCDHQSRMRASSAYQMIKLGPYQELCVSACCRCWASRRRQRSPGPSCSLPALSFQPSTPEKRHYWLDAPVGSTFVATGWWIGVWECGEWPVLQASELQDTCCPSWTCLNCHPGCSAGSRGISCPLSPGRARPRPRGAHPLYATKISPLISR